MSIEASTRSRIEPAPALQRRRESSGAGRVILREALGGLRRNGLMAVAATSTIVIALAVAGGGIITSANLAHLAAILEGQVEVVAFLREGLSPARQQRILASAGALPSVRTAVIVERSTALRRLQRTFGVSASTSDLLSANPLPDSIEVRVSDAARVREVADTVRQIPGISEVVFGTPVVDRLVALTRAVRIAGTVIAALLAVAALVIIMNTIRLTVASRRQEIEIMTLVGATPGFVRGPFLVEGALQGAAAALVTTVLLAVGYVMLASRAAESLPFLPLLPPADVMPTAILAVWLLGLMMGLCASAIGLRRYVRT
ncbi:MAG: permease-like cell division protein FtsX [bacterium]